MLLLSHPHLRPRALTVSLQTFPVRSCYQPFPLPRWLARSLLPSINSLSPRSRALPPFLDASPLVPRSLAPSLQVPPSHTHNRARSLTHTLSRKLACSFLSIPQSRLCSRSFSASPNYPAHSGNTSSTTNDQCSVLVQRMLQLNALHMEISFLKHVSRLLCHPKCFKIEHFAD